MSPLYEALKTKVAEHADPDTDITAYRSAMGVLNALWPTIEATVRRLEAADSRPEWEPQTSLGAKDRDPNTRG